MPMTEDGYVQGDGWCPGIDFDPYDRDEMEVMTVIFEGERLSALEKLRAENRRLQGMLTEDQQEAQDAAYDYASGYYDRDV